MLGTLSDAEIQSLLQSESIARIACRYADQILILPVTYKYHAGCAYCHSFAGTKIDWMRNNHQVGFEVDRITDHRNWKSVVAQGLFQELTTPSEIDAAKALLRASWQGDKSSITALPPAESAEAPHQIVGPSVFYTIRLFNITGRFEQARSHAQALL